MTPATFIVAAVVAAVFVAIVVSELRKRRRGESSCGGNCASCGVCSSCQSEK